MEAKKEDIKIYGKLVNVTTENVVADAEQIWDSYYRKNQTAVNRSMRDDFTKFAKNPTFESAVFTGDSTFQGNMAVEKSLSVKGSSKFQDQATFNGTIRAHGTPNGLVVDHKIITNDIEVMGTFQALNIDTNNLVVHNLLKVENGGSFRVDGDTILNNLLHISIQKNLTLSNRIFCTSPKTIRERLLIYLSNESRKAGSQEFVIPFDRQQLADYLNVDRSALSKELGKMRDEGLIEFRKNAFHLHSIC